MTIISEAETDQVTSARRGSHAASLFAVVGFDGTKPSQAALKVASELVRDRNGHLELVYVGYVPAYAGMSAEAILGIRQGFPEIAGELNESAHRALDEGSVDWHFQQREGAVAMELLAAATELRESHGADANIVIVVGSSENRLHRATRSYGAAMLHESEFPLLIVPPGKDEVTTAE